MSIFEPENGAFYDAEGNKIDKAAETSPVVVDAPETVTTTVETTQPETVRSASPTTEINWESVLSEKTGGKYKSWEDLLPKINQEATTPAELTFKDEESKRVFDYLREGKIDDVLQVYNEQRRLSNLDKANDGDVLRIAMEYKHPNLSPEDISEEIGSRYKAEKPDEPIEDDYIDDEAYKSEKKKYEKDYAKYEKEQKRLDRQLKLDAAAAREQLAGYQKDIILPDINPAPATNQPDPAMQEAELAGWKKMRQDYLDSLNKTSAEFKEISFEVNDEGVNFKGSYQIEDGERAALTKDLAEKNVIDDIILPRYDKGGVYDTRQLMEDLYFLNNKDKIIKAAVRQAIAQTDLENLKRLKNIDLNQQQRGVVNTEDPDLLRKEFARMAFGD
jgi:hypothetical protein